MRRAARKVLERMSTIYKLLRETFDGVRAVKAFTREPHERRRFRRATEDYYRKAMRVIYIDAFTSPMIEVLGVVAVGAALAAGTYLVVTQNTHILGMRMTAQPLGCQVRCDGAELFAGRAWQVTIACTGAFGGGAGVEADPRDGLLDVVVIGAGSRARLALHAYGMRAGRVERHAGVTTGGGREVEVETGTRTSFNIDGELVDAASLRFTVRPQAFEVVAP